jgi:hypothetical protein
MSTNSLSHSVSGHTRFEERDTLLTQLLFASRDLAHHQFSRRIFSSEIICIECRTPQINSEHLEHSEWCRTGRVIRVLSTLLALPIHQFKERSASRTISSEPAVVAVEEQPRSLPYLVTCGEPWSVNEEGEIYDVHGQLVVDPYGSELVEVDTLAVMQRIVDCVNSCAGFDSKGGSL